ncbi:hypothetical protein Afil01_68160 [Actinorhabdospora filicis]|uniref:Uncharacterized protein n=1 Tax=Actinorhabdospora filicis TaxID=1785913 RepID=A0A9W6WCV8_9ACTN|nr:hypothetical protein [Actinorhabdospora filicis]GLZ82009.1 hypothetical protein Afil01_68160 [Actinorhabdospora filicis]
MSQPYGPVSPADIRPKTTWYWVAGIIAVVGILLGCGALLLTGKLWSNALPDAKNTFASGEPMTVKVDEGEEKLIYVQLPYIENGNKTAPPNVTACEAGPEVTLGTPGYDLMLPDSQAKREWQAVMTMSASAAGSYQIVCVQTDGTLAVYGIGSMPFGGAILAGAGSLLVGIGLPCVCIVVALIIVIVVIVRRRSARRRLSGGGAAVDEAIRREQQRGSEPPQYSTPPPTSERYSPPPTSPVPPPPPPPSDPYAAPEGTQDPYTPPSDPTAPPEPPKPGEEPRNP